MMKNMYKKEYSELLNMFHGIHVSNVVSVESDYTNLTPEPFLSLDLGLPENSTKSGTTTNIYDCFDLYTKVETLETKIEVDEVTKKRESAARQIIFWSFPDLYPSFFA